MKFAYTMLSILVALFLISGCSEEKPETHESKNIVRKIIKKPVKKTDDWEETKKEIADIVNKDIDRRIEQETVKEEPLPAEQGIYITKQGDTLSDIAAKADIYNNPLKWPFLYRDNPEAFSQMKDKENFFKAGLPAGIELKIIPEEDVQKNLEDRAGYYYVANIISSPYMKEISLQVVKLIDAGYPVYITSTMIDGREWYRIRAGFYRTRSEASREGDRIKADLKIPDIWTVKIGKEEFHDFGGY